MQYGVDIGARRMDDLDKRVLARVSDLVATGTAPRVLDIGGGEGGLAVALAQAGANVVTLDVVDYQSEIEEYTETTPGARDNITIVTADMTTWVREHIEERFDLVVLQRVLHYVPYAEAYELLERLHTMTSEVYIAVSGTTTAIAGHYDELDLEIEKRFGILDEEGQRLFSITAPICLYSKGEVEELLRETGWEIVWSRVSDFGNVKVVGRRVRKEK